MISLHLLPIETASPVHAQGAPWNAISFHENKRLGQFRTAPSTTAYMGSAMVFKGTWRNLSLSLCHMCTHTHTHTHVSMCNVCIYIYIIEICKYINICVCMMYIRTLYICFFSSIYIYICIYIYIYLFMFVCRHIFVYLGIVGCKFHKFGKVSYCLLALEPSWQAWRLAAARDRDKRTQRPEVSDRWWRRSESPNVNAHNSPNSRQMKARIICKARPISNKELAIRFPDMAGASVFWAFGAKNLACNEASVGLLAGLPCFHASRAVRPN